MFPPNENKWREEAFIEVRDSMNSRLEKYKDGLPDKWISLFLNFSLLEMRSIRKVHQKFILRDGLLLNSYLDTLRAGEHETRKCFKCSKMYSSRDLFLLHIEKSCNSLQGIFISLYESYKIEMCIVTITHISFYFNIQWHLKE